LEINIQINYIFYLCHYSENDDNDNDDKDDDTVMMNASYKLILRPSSSILDRSKT
jgi:hypothetical protein